MKPLEKARIQRDRKWLEERQRVQSYDELMRSYAKSKGGCEECGTVDADIRWGETVGLMCRDCAFRHWAVEYGNSYENDRQRLLAFESFFDKNFEQIAIFHCSLCKESFVGLEDEVSASFHRWHLCYRDRGHYALLVREEPVRLYQCVDCGSQVVKKSGTQCDDCKVGQMVRDIQAGQLERHMAEVKRDGERQMDQQRWALTDNEVQVELDTKERKENAAERLKELKDLQERKKIMATDAEIRKAIEDPEKE